MRAATVSGFLIFMGTAGCIATPSATVPLSSPAPTLQAEDVSMARYRRVVSRMEGTIENACRKRVAASVNCDFLIVLDADPNKPANAFQSLNADGRPVLTFTAKILREFQNDDELAFVLGHEAAHHIAGHIPQMRQTTTTGAILGGAVAVLLGGGETAIDIGVDLGATVGARAYSKEHELEADSLGAILTERSGYSALRGAAYFERIPDPGNRFLGTHPPNQERIDTVRNTVETL